MRKKPRAKNKKKSALFIISGPSGVGEDSVIEGLKKYLKIERIITTTTRPMRPRELQGKPYYFISQKEFENKIKNDEMAEYAQEYNNNFYGVTKDELKRATNSGRVGVWKIEYKGVITAKKKFPEIKSIYIAAPSLEILKKRILHRSPNATSKYLKERIAYTREWMKHENIYDYKVINEEGKLNKTILSVVKIIQKNL